MWARFGIFSVVALVATVDLAQAAERRCLSKEQARAAVASGKAVRLEVALKAVKRRGNEVVGIHLCEGSRGLVYRLTVLARDGKVSRVTVDATSGSVLTGG
jgi:uncharacterized membrane protein YkoI